MGELKDPVPELEVIGNAVLVIVSATILDYIYKTITNMVLEIALLIGDKL